MADEFLKAICPDWEAMTEDERQEARRQLGELLDGPLNPVKRNAESEFAAHE